MSNDQEKPRRSKLLIPAVGLGLIIIALVIVASRGGLHDQAPVASSAPEAEAAPKAAVVWHDPREITLTTVFKDEAGTDKTLADFAGKAMVVNFWATWCAPCIKEMPTLDALQAQMGGDGFQVLAISQDREGAQVAKPFMDKNGWKNLALYTEAAGHFQKDADIRGLPTTIIIDKTGKEVGRAEGEINWTALDLVEKLKAVAGP